VPIIGRIGSSLNSIKTFFASTYLSRSYSVSPSFSCCWGARRRIGRSGRDPSKTARRLSCCWSFWRCWPSRRRPPASASGWLYICPPIGWLSGATRYWLPVILLVAALSQFWLAQGRFLRQVVPSALAFIDGSISIRQAYGAQQGWPGRHPWGGIFSGSIGAWETTGPGARIWSMHPFAYCMLPHCRSETFQSFILSPHLLDMLVGSAEETRDILQREGLNYFFYTTEMEVCDVLPLTKPFAPDGIANYLGIKWNDGTSYLVTWLGPGVTRLTPEWVAQYKEAVESAPNCPRFFPLQLMLSLREQMRGGARRGRDLKFPGITQPKGS
jgi:hypothetical protein